MKTTRPFRPFSRLGKTKTPAEPPPKSRPTPFRERREALTGFLAVLLGLAAPAHALEHTTGFEVDIRGWTVIKGTSQFNWARQTRGTHSGHTGPSGAHEGDYYLYLEASRNYPSRTAYLQSREFSGKIQTVSFHYHMYGAHMGSLALEGLDGNSWITLWATTGQQHANHQAPWTREEVTLSGRTIQKIRFKGTTTDNPNGGQYRGDMAIDYITVTTDKIVTSDHWQKTESEDGLYYGPGNVGIGDKQPQADLSILGNLSRPLTGYVGVLKGSPYVTGVNTRFTRELRVGDSIRLGDKVFVVAAITSDIALTLNAAHPVGVFNATAYTDGDLLSVQTGAEVESLVIDKSGNVGVGAANPAVKLDVAGGIRVGAETVCDAAREGTIRYNDAGDEIEFCNGSAWSRVEGPKGDTGGKGDKGDKGDTGLQGLKGDKGDTGLQGLKGDPGLKGDKGDTGPQGAKGNTGATGPQGIQGKIGPQGPKGDKGDKGDAFWAQSGSNISYGNGNVGIGTASPTYKLQIEGGWVGIRDSNKPDSAINFETQNGFHRFAFNELRFYDWENGADTMTIEDGKVGIGTTAPLRTLDVRGNIIVNNENPSSTPLEGGEIVFANGDPATTPTWHIDHLSDNLRIFRQSNNPNTTGVEFVWVTNSGNVGIGSTNPQAKLHIGGHLSGTYRNWMKKGVIVGDESDGGYFGLKDEGSNREDTVIVWGDDSQDNLRFIFAGVGGAQNGEEAMRINSSGNVGIGTENPAYTLDVSSANNPIRIGPNSGARSLLLGGWGTGTSEAWVRVSNGNLHLDSKSGHGLYLNHYHAGPIFMGIGGGNVGIGTENPAYKLDVVGTIRGNNVSPSDARLKKDIRPLENPLDKITRVRGVSFHWKDEKKGTDREIGVIAQEVEKEFPELVSTDGEGYKSVAYGKLTAVLIEAVKAQRSAMEAQRSAMEAQQSRITALEAEVRDLRDRAEK